MTDYLIVAATVVLLALALEPAHRRARRLGSSRSPAATPDRDRQRLVADLRQVQPRVPVRQHPMYHRHHHGPAV